jgi:hypothetical protein
MNFIKKHWVQIVVSIMLFYALSESLPYSYYQILRWVVSVSSGFLALNAFKEDKKVWGWIFIVSLILFNPIASIHFQRETWEILNVVFGVIYLYSIKKIKIK